MAHDGEMQQPAGRRRGTLVPMVILGLSLVTLVAAPTAWYVTREAATPAPPSLADQVVTDDAFEGEAATEDDAAAGTQGSASPAGSASIQLLPSAPQEPQPALFMVPSLQISTQIRSVGVRDDGQVAIPDDGDLVGWYRFGSAPGSPQGSSVIVGHRDTKAEGPGVLYPLARVEIGQEITVYREDWSKVSYRVTAKESVNKTVLPLEQLFTTAGAPRLTVITCGGDYVKGRGYEENVVVTAVPTGA